MSGAERASGGLDQWVSLLRGHAAAGLDDTPLLASASPGELRTFVRGFQDERAHRRAVDTPFLCWVAGIAPEEKADQVGTRLSPDVALWWSLHDATLAEQWLPQSGSGALAPELSGSAIETWTEAELCALHALSWHASRTASDSLRERMASAALWHVNTLQPDNATGHPWAIHVFLWLWNSTGRQEARLHAEFLLGGALSNAGRPDRFSAAILLDAARWLETG